ncbi:MAG: hypothetical protein FWE54_00455 [Methanimicrococcus sp.]|nr:hypothetical protein [Methanimicrococcus sp.]
MEKLSRGKLDAALDSLKKLRKEEADGGHFPIILCYSPGLDFIIPEYYLRDSVPGEYVCPKCGKCFGTGEKKETVIGVRGYNFIVSKRDFDEIFEAYNICIKKGFDVEFELHCSNCCLKDALPFAVFKFRKSKEEEYTASYPQMRNEDSGRNEALISEKHFYLWQYALAIEFLTEVVACENGTNQDEACLKWIVNVISRGLYMNESRMETKTRWFTIEKSIKGILGFSFERQV